MTPLTNLHWRCVALLLPLYWLLFASLPAGAAAAGDSVATSDPVSVRRKAVETEAATIHKLASEIEVQRQALQQKLDRLKDSEVTDAQLEEARLALEAAQVNVQSVRLDRSSARNQIKELQTAIGKAAEPAAAGVEPAAKEVAAAHAAMMEQKQALLDLEQQHLKQLAEKLDLLREKVGLAQRWWQALKDSVERQKEARRQESLADLEQQLQRKEQTVQTEVAKLRAELASLSGDDPVVQARRQLLTNQIAATEESIYQLRTRLKLARIRAELEKLVAAPPLQAPVVGLKQPITRLEQLQKALETLAALTRSKLDVGNQQLNLLEKQQSLGGLPDRAYRAPKKQLAGLITGFEKQGQQIATLTEQARKQREMLEASYSERVKQSLTARERLPKSQEVWQQLLDELIALPGTLWRLVQDGGRELVDGWNRAEIGQRIGLLGLLLALVGFTLALGRLPQGTPSAVAEDQIFALKAKEVTYDLLRCSRAILLVGGLLLGAGWMLGLTPGKLHLLSLIFSVWLVMRWTMRLSYWVFASPLVSAERRQPELHRLILWVSTLSALFTILVGLGHLGYLSEGLSHLVDRLFMLLLFPAVYFGLRLRTLLVARLQAESRSRFWVSLVSLVSFALPLVVLAAASVGLAGYINLAWFLAVRLALFVGVLLLWMVLRHLFLDLMTGWRRRLEGDSEARVWQKEMLNPLQWLGRLALALGVGWALIHLLAWGTEVDVAALMQRWLSRPLFQVVGKGIDAADIIGALLLVVLVFYVGSRVRRLTYGWLYRAVGDRGLRNSLSIFTQYLVILIGLLVALNLLGFNLTSLTVFAGAVGVGIGFGLQNIANNFISGLILLAERPVRTEDWVSIADNEGRVSRIGLRSLTVTTWDNQDVIIPNAQLITNPFVNWTLSDKLVRTIFMVGVRYEDDPHRAAEVMLEAVSMQPEVSLERPPKVLLMEFADSSVNFRVEYYVDVEQFGRLLVKSKVMFAIWDALQEAGIGIPFPQQDIYVKELPERRTPNDPGGG